MEKEKVHVDLAEALQVLKELYEKSVQKMKKGTETHGTELIKNPYEELQEELADAWNYIVLGYIKVLKALGGYYEKWECPDPMSRIRRVLDETKRKKGSHNRSNKRNR